MTGSEIQIECPRRNLLQSFRAMQAIAEAGFLLHIPPRELARWDYTSRWFDLPYRLATDNPPTLKIQVDHAAPRIEIGPLVRPLLFSHTVLDRYKMDGMNRDVLVSFRGAMTSSRKRTLEEWRRENLSRSGNPTGHSNNRVVIRATRKGRNWPAKGWDEDYAKLLSSSRFVLCPDGDFVWTYRFFEAVAAGAIPIVENESPHYLGFHYFRMSDSLQTIKWSRSASEMNLVTLRTLTTGSREAIYHAVRNSLY